MIMMQVDETGPDAFEAELDEVPSGKTTTPSLTLPGPSRGDLSEVPRKVTRGTTNGNSRGGSESRRRRREWLVATYRADVDALLLPWDDVAHTDLGKGDPACRCYRCGTLLTADTVTVDRIVPGCRGGTYRRNNIRPACGPCNSETGGATRSKR